MEVMEDDMRYVFYTVVKSVTEDSASFKLEKLQGKFYCENNLKPGDKVSVIIEKIGDSIVDNGAQDVSK